MVTLGLLIMVIGAIVLMSSYFKTDWVAKRALGYFGTWFITFGVLIAVPPLIWWEFAIASVLALLFYAVYKVRDTAKNVVDKNHSDS